MVSNFGIFAYMFLTSNESVWVFSLMSVFGRSVIKWMELWMLYIYKMWRVMFSSFSIAMAYRLDGQGWIPIKGIEPQPPIQ
jgi:hypothetical protein